MKLIHLSDLHLGKRMNEFSMQEDQEYILRQILRVIREEKPDGVLIAGDVYDKSVPSAEAMKLFDEFLVQLSELKQTVMIISGNHDSAERLAFASRLLNRNGIYLSPVYCGKVEPVILLDAFGEVRIFLLPFLKPAQVRALFPEEKIESYSDAMRVAISKMPLAETGRNVLVTHQFVAGAERCESEELSIGGTDSVDVSVFDAFDYVALGHLHGPQKVGRETVRYCGTPLKYSFSEVSHQKSVTVVELGGKGAVQIRTVPLKPLRDLCNLRGTYLELTAKSFYEQQNRENYVRITLTDEEDVPDAVGKLRILYPNLMRLEYDNRRTRGMAEISADEQVEKKSPLELLMEFYEKQNNQPMSEEQRAFAENVMETLWGEDQ